MTEEEKLIEKAKGNINIFRNQVVSGLAELMYETYCDGVGGVAFNGDALPSWKELATDESKRKQAEAWVLSARASIEAIKRLL